jgi:hypothetical protein
MSAGPPGRRYTASLTLSIFDLEGLGSCKDLRLVGRVDKGDDISTAAPRSAEILPVLQARHSRCLDLRQSDPHECRRSIGCTQDEHVFPQRS